MTLREQFESLKYNGFVCDNKTDANGCEHSGADGRFVEKGGGENTQPKKKGVAAKLRDEFNKNTNKYINKDFINKKYGIKARFNKKSQEELRSRTDHSKENGFTLQEHFEVANQIKELFENAHLKREHDDTKNGDKNLKIERFLSMPILLKSGKKARALITVKHSLDKDGHNIYSIEAMDIKNALEKTRAKGQPKDSVSPYKTTITHDTAEVKSLYEIFEMIKRDKYA